MPGLEDSSSISFFNLTPTSGAFRTQFFLQIFFHGNLPWQQSIFFWVVVEDGFLVEDGYESGSGSDYHTDSSVDDHLGSYPSVFNEEEDSFTAYNAGLNTPLVPFV